MIAVILVLGCFASCEKADMEAIVQEAKEKLNLFSILVTETDDFTYYLNQTE